jgi:chemotaxis protein methyltransferase CheR
MVPDLDIEEIEMRLVLEAINARYGYDFRDYSPESMRRRVQAALARSGAQNLGLMQHRLLCEPDFFASLFDDLTVHVTEMFRDPSFYRVFRELVIPVLRTYPQLKIWHAGCASGEEVYATAILLSEENLYERTQIYATDMSGRAVEQAREGIYPASQAETFSDNYRQSGGKHRLADYYSSAYGRIAVHEKLKRNVVFFQHDLVSDYALGEMQVVFCRNVLIYFGENLRARVLGVFADCLCRGGFLCLGGSERVSRHAPTFFPDFASAEQNLPATGCVMNRIAAGSGLRPNVQRPGDTSGVLISWTTEANLVALRPARRAGVRRWWWPRRATGLAPTAQREFAVSCWTSDAGDGQL